MDYIGNKCPVCSKYFHADDDIVVCPECGTPHHRECYEQLGHCYNESLHSQGYDYAAESDKNTSADTKKCPSCGEENDKDSFFCKRCGTPLSQDRTRQNDQTYGDRQGAPFSPFSQSRSDYGDYSAPFIDPLGGVPSDTDLGDGVTAGEAAKYVKQNTPYFIRVFSNIKNFNKSKFNFAAAIFTGGYMLYRKMYKLGAIFTGLQVAMLVYELYLTLTYSSLFTDFAAIYANASSMSDVLTNYSQYLANASATDMLVLYLPTIIDILRVVLMIVMGICFNRLYFSHCKKQITAIKINPAEGENPDTVLQTKGGVNTALAISLLVSYLIISYLPQFLIGLF